MSKGTTGGRGLGAGLIVFLAAFAVCGTARADGSITIESTSASQARVTIAHPDHWISTQLSPDYRVCWKVKGQWQGICDANKVEIDQNNNVYISGLTVGETYKIKAWCYCAKNSKTVFQWRDMDVEREYTHAAPPPPAPTLVSTQKVRLRNLATNQCLWIDGNRVRHWVCWADPNQAFDVETYSNGSIYLRHKNSGKCIWGKRSSLPIIASASCGTLGTQFQLNAVTGGVHLYIPLTRDIGGTFGGPAGPGGCLYTGAGDGGDALKQKPCTSDPKFTFVLVPA